MALIHTKQDCMAKLIYSMLTSLDGHTEDAQATLAGALPKLASLLL